MKEREIVEILKKWAEVVGEVPREQFLKKYNLSKEKEELINTLIDEGFHLRFVL